MNLYKREWVANSKSTLLWSLGIVVLILMAFYEMDSMNTMEGGLNALMEGLPPVLQIFFGTGSDYTTGIGLYSIFHMYILIALSLHAVILGASLFAKEEKDRTFEFLYVKGMQRWKILLVKILTGFSILLVLDILVLCAIIGSLALMDLPFLPADFMPYIVALFLAQLFFFSITLLLTFVLPNNRKAGMAGCCLVIGMFLVAMYTKLGGEAAFLKNLSVFHYLDSDVLRKNGLTLVPSLALIVCSIGAFELSIHRHEHRDLL